MSADVSLDAVRMQAALAHWMSHDPNRGLIVTDREFRIVVWNDWLEIHSGLCSHEMMGRVLFDACPGMAAHGIREYYESALDGSMTIVSHGLHRRLIALSPTNVDLGFDHMPQSANIGPLSDQGVVLGTVTIIEDVSSRLATEVELRRQIDAHGLARAAAEQALHAKDQFLSTLSHELRTPLNAVLGWARILLSRKTIDTELLDRALQVIERNATAQAKMIDDMLDMARIVSGKLRLEMQPADLVNIVLAAVDVVTPTADAKKISVRTNLDPTTPQVTGDPDRLQQIVVNLLSNAVKFTDSGGTIDVRLGAMGAFTTLVVHDTGRGISREFLPHVFERFRQSDSSSTRRHGGLGLGLGLVRDLVELHGGAVRADSPGEGHGSTFTVHLPAVTTTEARRDSEHTLQEHGPSALSSVRVLLIEDERDARDLALTTLVGCGAEVSAVSSSAEAVTTILDATPDTMPHVVVSDIGMPIEDGYAFIRRLRSLTPERGGQIPAVTVTGYSSPDDVDRVLAAGYQIHLPKPMDPFALVEAVARLSRDPV